MRIAKRVLYVMCLGNSHMQQMEKKKKKDTRTNGQTDKRTKGHGTTDKVTKGQKK